MIRVVSSRMGGISARRGEVIVEISRPNILGNPYRESASCSRQQCIELYERLLTTAMKQPMGSSDIKDEIIRITRLLKAGKRVALRCWCAPLPCHGDVIKKMIEDVFYGRLQI